MSGDEWAPEAFPQSPLEVGLEPRCPAVVAAALDRGIADVVHFTRYSGLVGILGTGDVKGRSYLADEELVEFVYRANAEDRSRDTPWHDYVNLSVTAINKSLFKTASQTWHPSSEWVILCFGPEILGDPGVVFTTSNNAYDTTHHATGIDGLNQMFADSVPWGYHGSIHTRQARTASETTDPQAEVLYPHSLGVDNLHTVVVPSDDLGDRVHAALSISPLSPNIRCDPGAFR